VTPLLTFTDLLAYPGHSCFTLITGSTFRYQYRAYGTGGSLFQWL